MTIPKEAAVHYNSGCAFMENKELQEARLAFEDALECFPNFVAALFNLGNCLLDLGKNSEASCYYVRAINIDPNDSAIHFNYGRALVRMNLFKEAVAELDLAIKIAPRNSEMHYTLALYCAAAELPAKACRHGIKAISLSPLAPICYTAMIEVVLLNFCNIIIRARTRKQ